MTEQPPEAAPRPPARPTPSAIGSELAAEASSIATVRHAIVDFARGHGADVDDVERIALAVSEAVTNVVCHAYPTGTVGPMRYLADVEDDDLQVVIADAGAGLDGRHREPGLGMGLQLIADVTADFSLNTLEGGGFEVWMRFILRES